MAKFSEVARGTRARRPAVLPLPGAAYDGERGKWAGDVVDLHVRPLREDEYELVLERALAFARKRGLENPEEGDALYERGKILHTLALACVDKDSPEDAPALFFDGGVEQIQQSEVMTPEVVGYLYEQQLQLQDDVAPTNRELTPAQFMSAALTTAKGHMGFFVNSRPGTRWSFTRTLASLYIASLATSSPSSPSSSSPEKTGTSESPSEPH